MKNNIKITNLTQIHIGSGETLQLNTDFIVVPTADGKDSDIFVIDPDRVGELIGDNQKVFQQWTASIDNGDTNSFFKLFLKGHNIKEYSKRRITNFAGFKSTMTLKECIHDGMGRPYIPGSSLKGAIRTAIITFLADRMPQSAKEDMISTLKKNGRIEYHDIVGKRYNSAEDVLLGSTPNDSLTRFIRVGDAFYEKGTEIAVNQISLNETHKPSLIDKSKIQAVEAIGADETSSFSLAIDKQKYENVYANRERDSRELGDMKHLPDELSTIASLFKVINDHTKKLVETDIAYWESKTKQGAEDYLDSMKEILNSVNSCKEGECVMRVGQATGWRFITGAWTEDLDGFYKYVVPLSRPNNYKYEEYDFPKSRRIDSDSYLFGFVKLKTI